METVYIVKQVRQDWYNDTNGTTVLVALSTREAAEKAIETLPGSLEVYALQVHSTFSEGLPKAKEVLVYGGYTNLAGTFVKGWLDGTD